MRNKTEMQSTGAASEGKAHDHLTLRVGEWFEASASGRLAIAALVLLGGGWLVCRVLGWL